MVQVRLGLLLLQMGLLLVMNPTRSCRDRHEVLLLLGLLVDWCGVGSVSWSVLMAMVMVVVDPTGLRCVVVLEEVLSVGGCVLLIICLARCIRGCSTSVGDSWPRSVILLAWSDLDRGTPFVGRVADLVRDHVPSCDCWVG